MLDLALLKAKASELKDDEVVGLTQAAFAEMIAELEAGRKAMDRLGETFGLGRGRTL